MPAPGPAPYELDDTLVVAAGTVAWLVGGLVLLVVDLTGGVVPVWQHLTVLTGVVLGVLGLRVVARGKQRARRARRRAR